jgi:Tfp pilus assembly protein PilO
VLGALPSVYDYPALLSSIDYLVKRSGMTLDSLSGEDLSDEAIGSQTDPQPIEIPMNINVLGDYESLQTLITNINRSTRPIKIKQIKVSGSDKNMKAEISFITYYQPKISIDIEEKEIR